VTEIEAVCCRARAVLREGPSAILTDVDGTISGIVPRPEDARVAPAVRDSLERLAKGLALVAVITARAEETARRMVGAPGLTYVGRLDYLTEGILLLTTDGAAAHALTHPATGVDRTYVATVKGNAPEAVVAARRGVVLEDGLVRPEHVSARALGGRTWEFVLSLREGRHREVRRLCDALGLEVQRLVRTRYGPVALGKLAPGACRPLTARERAALQAVTGHAG